MFCWGRGQGGGKLDRIYDEVVDEDVDADKSI